MDTEKTMQKTDKFSDFARESTELQVMETAAEEIMQSLLMGEYIGMVEASPEEYIGSIEIHVPKMKLDEITHKLEFLGYEQEPNEDNVRAFTRMGVVVIVDPRTADKDKYGIYIDTDLSDEDFDSMNFDDPEI